MIVDVQGNLFDAERGSLLVHACNTQGTWGAGIAADFARLYPEYFKAYKSMCDRHGNNLLGKALVLRGKYHDVGCLFTSTKYGHQALYRDKILKATFHSLVDLFGQIPNNEIVHMPKINSGLFRVPWELTRSVVSEFDEREIRVWAPSFE